VIDKENTTIVNGSGKKKDIEAASADQGADRGDHFRLRREKLQERLASSPAASPSFASAARPRSR